MSTAQATRDKPPVVVPGSGNNIIINPNQRLNPLLECIRNVGKQFGEIVPDFQVGRTTCVLYLSLKYHRLHPEYIHARIEKLGHAFNLRILLIMCDVSEHQDPIRELTKTCLINNITIIVAWSLDEAGHYLSTFKQFEHKPPDLIKERAEKDYDSVLRAALTSINKVNKTDVETLRTSVGLTTLCPNGTQSFADIARTPSDQLLALPGFGQVKVRRIKDALERPFKNKATSATFTTTSQSLAVTERVSGEEGGASEPTRKGGTEQPPVSAAAASSSSSKAGPSTASSAPRPRPPRSPSPVWDIELDLDSPPPARDTGGGDAGASSKPQPRPKSARAPSPAWDIELDLNPPDDAEEIDSPKDPERPTTSSFGAPKNLINRP
ncbi:hypothetical protein CONPUDRAFT_143024 [Coniophora puteana RWD-64-598 SS2]|uniref:ERCC1-like central domain-containing protein n=1 Tax=Coniophora puteana (strain RWD-64-598) TaxID=741705 RepID=A0A5M3MW26_CONPW|nr:uncharacterized protein CONPUDRAFT_143024 [Coniophora puteana RWD-64-598 SS2]EIW82934.1 hypothetical protein CONPUDRAFT_143024 [Coniophora puteana RWD-64-598 SS2]